MDFPGERCSPPCSWVPRRGPSRNPAMGLILTSLSPTLVVVCEHAWSKRRKQTNKQPNKQKGQERSRLLQGLMPGRTKRWSQRFLSIKWGHLLSTFKSKHVPLQLFKSYGTENSIAERNVAFVIKSSFSSPFSKPTGTNWTETWLFKRLKSCHPPGSYLWPFFLCLSKMLNMFAECIENASTHGEWHWQRLS